MADLVALSFSAAPLAHLLTLKVRSTAITNNGLTQILSLATSLRSLDCSYSEVTTLDPLLHALALLPTFTFTKLVASGLPLPPKSLERFLAHVASRPADERALFKKLKLGSIPANSTRSPGLSDAVFATLLPHLEELSLEHISLFSNHELGRRAQPMERFISGVGKRCIVRVSSSLTRLG